MKICDEMLEHLERLTNFLIGERDCFYEGCSTDEGEVPDEDDRQVLASMDADIVKAQDIISRAKVAA